MARTRCAAMTRHILALFLISIVIINGDDVGGDGDKLSLPSVNTGKQQQQQPQQQQKDAGNGGTFPPLAQFEDPKGAAIDPVSQPDDQVTNDPDVQTIEPSTIDDANWLFGPSNNKNDKKSAKNDDHDQNTATAVPSDDVISTTDSIDAELKRILDEMDRKNDAFNKNQSKTIVDNSQDRQIEARVPPRLPDLEGAKPDQWVPIVPTEDQSGRPMIQPTDFIGGPSDDRNPNPGQSDGEKVMKAIDTQMKYFNIINNVSKIVTSDYDASKSAVGASSVTSDDNVEATAVPLMKQDMDPFGNMFKSFNSQPNVPQPDQTLNNTQNPQDKQLEKIWVITDNGENIRPLQLSIDNSKNKNENGNDQNNATDSNGNSDQGRPLPPLPDFIIPNKNNNDKKADIDTFPDMEITPGAFPGMKNTDGPFPDMKITPGPFPDVDITPGPFPDDDIISPGPFPIANQPQQLKINDSDLFSLFSILFSDNTNQKNNKNGQQRLVDKPQLPKIPTSDDGTPSDSSAPQTNPIFCKAKCMQSCMDTDGNSMPDCDLVCTDVTANDLCSSNDQVCQKACGSSPMSNEFNAPNITDVKYFTMGEVVDPETVEVTWDPLPGATIYIIDFIPNSRSVESGSFIVKEDITNVPWYSFKKDDLCYEYYVRVAAVYKDGITPYSVPKFLKGAFTTYPLNFKVDVGEISAPEVTLFDKDGIQTTTFAQVDMELYSLQHMDLSKLELSSYLLVSDCKNMPDDSQEMGEPVQNGKYKVGTAQFLYIDQAISMRLPVKYASYDCKYEFRIASVKTRCGDVISFISSSGKSYDSTTGTDFRLNCGNVPYDGCSVGTSTPVTPSNDDNEDDQNKQQQQQMTTVTNSGPNCDMTGFTADVMGNMFDKFNVTISWDAVNDMLPKAYVVRHGVAHRRLVVPSEFEMTYDPEDDIKIYDDGKSDAEQKSVRLNRPLSHNELHVFQICAIYDLSRDSDVLWELVPKHVLDMAAFPTPTLDTVPKNPDSDSDSNTDNNNSNNNAPMVNKDNSNPNMIMNPDMIMNPNMNQNSNPDSNNDNSNNNDALAINKDNSNPNMIMNPDMIMNQNSNPDSNNDNSNNNNNAPVINKDNSNPNMIMNPNLNFDMDPNSDFNKEFSKSQKAIVDPPAGPSNDDDLLNYRQKFTNPNVNTNLDTNTNTNTKSEYEAVMLGRSLQMSWFLLATALFSFFCFLVVVTLLLVRYNGGCQKGVKKFPRPSMPQFLVRRTPSMKKPILADVDIENVSTAPPTPTAEHKPQANDQQQQADHKQPQI